MKHVIIEVRGGVIVGVYCDFVNFRFFIVDWDNKVGGICDDNGIGYDEAAISLAQMPVDTRQEYERANIPPNSQSNYSIS